MIRTRVTTKHQTTIPRDVRRRLGIRPGGEVEWHVAREFAVVVPPHRVRNPVRALVSQVRLDVDAVAVVRRARQEMF